MVGFPIKIRLSAMQARFASKSCCASVFQAGGRFGGENELVGPEVDSWVGMLGSGIVQGLRRWRNIRISPTTIPGRVLSEIACLRQLRSRMDSLWQRRD